MRFQATISPRYITTLLKAPRPTMSLRSAKSPSEVIGVQLLHHESGVHEW